IQAINWLEEFLINFENTVIVVSHDRHFLNKVCKHMADLDFGKIKLSTVNNIFIPIRNLISVTERLSKILFQKGCLRDLSRN
ncbi:MAG: hypothetical protein IKD75_03910, partial [Prevotella sp.]|nr:hypothetical protein [Prevotella sp.]